MRTIPDKTMIVSLIKDDLTNTRLINGLNALGLSANDYFLHLSETIFKLMGLEGEQAGDVLYERYLELGKKAEYIMPGADPAALDALAEEIYAELAGQVTG